MNWHLELQKDSIHEVAVRTSWIFYVDVIQYQGVLPSDWRT